MTGFVRCLACILLLLSAASAPAAPPGPAPAFAYPPPYTMSSAADKAVMPLPLILSEDRNARSICVEKIGVQFKGVIDARFTDSFQVDRRLGTNTKEGPVVTVTVNAVSALAPGNYQLRLRLFECRPGKPEKTIWTTVVEINRPGIKLEQPDKITIDRWLPYPWAETETQVTPPRLRLRPQDPAVSVALAGIEVEPSMFTSANGGANVGSWRIMPATKTRAGPAFDIGFTATAFPVGVASGKLHVRGPDLEAPLQIDVDVRTRLLPRWIVFAVVLGVLAGLLLRVHLQHQVDLARARQPALEKLHRYQEDLDRIPDAAFQTKVRSLLEHLHEAIEADDPQAVTTAAAAADKDVNAAREQLNIDVKAASAAIDRFRNAFDVRSRLPPDLRATCDTAVAAANACADLLAPPNPTAAQDKLRKHERHVFETLADLLATLGNALDRVLTPLDCLTPFLTEAASREVKERIQGVRAIRQAIKPPADLDSAGSMATAVAQIVRDLRALLDRSAQALEFDAPELDALIKSRARPGMAVQSAELTRQWQAMVQSLREQAQLDDTLAAPAWNYDARALRQAGRALLEKLAAARSDLTEDARDLFRKTLDEGAWHRALAGLKATDSRLSGRESAAANLPPPPEPAEIVRGRQSLRIPGIGAFSPLAIASAARRNRKRLAIAQASMSVLVALLLAWACFAFYEKDFVGTWGELLVLFFLGFSADLNADKLASTLGFMLPK